MGTSQSSGGPGPGVPMVPSWTPPPPAEDLPAGPPPGDADQVVPGDGQGEAPPDTTAAPRGPIPVAPSGRFLGARRSLTEFARTGDGNEMRKSLGRYVRFGYGGARTATQRFGGTAATAGALGGALAGIASGQPVPPGSPLDPALLAGRSVNDVMDAVIEAVRPIDGTQDAEAERAAIRDSLSELLTRFPDADLLNLDADQRTFAIERFTAIDVFRRFELDLGKTIQEKAPNAAAALGRLKQVRDYVKEAVGAAFRKLRDAGRTLTAGRIGRVVTDALKETFEVFEGYAE